MLLGKETKKEDFEIPVESKKSTRPKTYLDTNRSGIYSRQLGPKSSVLQNLEGLTTYNANRKNRLRV